MEDLIKKHRKILKHYNIENFDLCISAIFCVESIENIEKTLVECNNALLGIPFNQYLQTPGEGWSVNIDPENIGEKLVEVEFIYTDEAESVSNIPLWLYKSLLNERYMHIKDKELFYWNNQVKRKGCYLNGLREGLWIEYFDNGNIKSKGKYEKYKKIGIWKYYYFNGQIKEERDHEVKFHFISQKLWYENGQIKSNLDWDEKEQCFNVIHYFESGEIKSTQFLNKEGVSIRKSL
ncbi:toxin-antitoxin system YwqK family antitoxin [Kordia sp.]|uniref:toxin-antitoxin system YwqK family antitoxin n=1 Tax=Kordia sp. TaxID=1965332 RepID=UPI003D6B3988